MSVCVGHGRANCNFLRQERCQGGLAVRAVDFRNLTVLEVVDITEQPVFLITCRCQSYLERLDQGPELPGETRAFVVRFAPTTLAGTGPSDRRASPPLAGPRRHSAEIRWEGDISKQGLGNSTTSGKHDLCTLSLGASNEVWLAASGRRGPTPSASCFSIKRPCTRDRVYGQLKSTPDSRLSDS
ncbi:hypothetical protein Bbelb_141520 [Branchiostoma belcheri]|nr:hypothetical protein Bbelb_141520 [Branchiostoma belcheri]